MRHETVTNIQLSTQLNTELFWNKFPAIFFLLKMNFSCFESNKCVRDNFFFFVSFVPNLIIKYFFIKLIVAEIGNDLLLFYVWVTWPIGNNKINWHFIRNEVQSLVYVIWIQTHFIHQKTHMSSNLISYSQMSKVLCSSFCSCESGAARLISHMQFSNLLVFLLASNCASFINLIWI